MIDEDEVRDLNVGVGGDGDQERRVRREIANSNERRRMQSINAGFQSLRTLLPHHEGEKLSKAAILQQTAEYIYQLEQEKTRLLSQNSQLKRLYSLSQQGLTSPNSGGQTGSSEETTSPRLKKKRLISNTSNNTIVTSLENTSEMLKAESEAATAPSSGGNEMYQNRQDQSNSSSNQNNQNNSSNPSNTSVSELSLQLMNEQRLRMRLEERLKSLEQQAASVAPTTTPTTVVTTAKPPVPVAVLPTQPLKMEVVNPTAAATLQPKVATEQISVKTSAGGQSSAGPRPYLPGTILLADKNGIRVEVEAVAGLPQVPVGVTLQPAQAPLAQTAAVAVGAAGSEVVVASGKASREAVSVASVSAAAGGSGGGNGNMSAGALPAEELKTVANNVVTTAAHPATSRSYIVTTGSQGGPSASNAAAPNTRQNLDSIVEAIRHLEGDHLFSEDSHKVVKEEVVEYNTPIQAQATNLSSQHHHVTVTKNLVPSKIVVGMKPPVVSTSNIVTTNPIPATLLPMQPHPPSAVMHQQNTSHAHPKTPAVSESNSIIIVKSFQTK